MADEPGATTPPTAEGDVLARTGADLADAVDAATAPWIEASVVNRLGRRLTDDERAAVERSAATARASEGALLRQLLSLDLDDQWTNPLAVLRAMVVYPTEILSDAGATPVERDDHAEAIAPDDIYDLTPASFADFGPDVHEPGLLWGAAKAYVHLQRRKAKETA